MGRPVSDVISGSEPRALRQPKRKSVCGNGFLSVQKIFKFSVSVRDITVSVGCRVALGPPATRTLVGTREGLGSVAWGWGGWGAGGGDQTAGGGLECGEPGRAVIQSVDKNVSAA